MKNQRSFLALAFATTLAVLPSAQAGMFNLNPDASDARVLNPNNGNPVTIIDQGNYAARIGEQNAPGGTAYVFAFQLPTFTGGDTAFTAATLRLQLFDFVNGNAAIGNVDFYGLGVRASAAPLITDYYQGPLDTSNTLIQQGFLTPTSPVRTDATTGPFNTTSTPGATALLGYLNTVDPAGTNAGKFVLFRLSYNLATIPAGNDAYTVLTQDAGGANEKPLLALTTGVATGVPEPSTVMLLGLMGTVVVALRRRRK